MTPGSLSVFGSSRIQERSSLDSLVGCPVYMADSNLFLYVAIDKAEKNKGVLAPPNFSIGRKVLIERDDLVV